MLDDIAIFVSNRLVWIADQLVDYPNLMLIPIGALVLTALLMADTKK